MTNGMKQLAIEFASIEKPHLGLRRMNIDVDFGGGHLKSQEAARKAADHQQPTIRFAQGMLQGAVADGAAVEEQVLQAVVAAGDTGIADIASPMKLSFLMVDRD